MGKWRFLCLLVVVWGSGLMACAQQDSTAVPTPPLLAATQPPVTAVSTAEPAPELSIPTPVPQPTASATAVFPPPNYFAHIRQFIQNDARQTAVSGILMGQNGPQLTELPIPGGVRVFSGDYARTSNQILFTDRAHAAGPASLAAGPLRRLTMSSGQTDTLIADNVVNFAWAPDGKAFAYILAVDDTYQLRWHSAIGEDFLLAVDVPRAFSIAPSGDKIAFTRESGYDLGGEPGLYVVDIASRQEQQISAVDRAGLGGSDAAWQPIWSPDESSLLLQLSAADGPRWVWLAANGRAELTFPAAALDEAVNAIWQQTNPDAAKAMCANTTMVLLNGRTLITGVASCPQPNGGQMPGRYLALFSIDAETGEVAVKELLSLTRAAILAGWATPGESVFVVGEEAVVVVLPAAPASPSTLTAVIDPATETSPDGLWQAIYGLSAPVESGDNGQVYRAYLAVQQVGGNVKWTAVDEWRPYGLGLDYPAPLQWSGDGRYLYFTNRPIVDGCGLFANGSDLWRLDLTDGTYVQLVSYVGTSIALSPDEQTLAYASFGSGGPRQVILRNVATGAERTINLDDDLPATAGNLVWSPDGARLLATVAYNPCLPPDWTHSIFLVDVAAATAVPLINHDDRRFTTMGWMDTAVARLIDTDGASWLLDANTGDLTPIAK
ncbi:MAG: PD40 domain-containing protein [Chloroflexi bacterium]|nr:PD40 domain-containing protein [Chloroflexota bacterium]MBP7041422.1 PD40 domain-containing protein [Chloroflexota bacterium]